MRPIVDHAGTASIASAMTSSNSSNPSKSPSARIIVANDVGEHQVEVVSFLERHGMKATAVAARSDLLRSIDFHDPDAVILESRFDTLDSLDVLQDIRKKSSIPVILVGGSQADEASRVAGLELGADDYLSRPFALSELLARTRALLRRRDFDNAPKARSRYRQYRFAGWLFNQRLRRLERLDGIEQPLTNTEFALLSAFVTSAGVVLTREQLLRATRRHEDIADRSIDVQVLRLRRKLENPSSYKEMIRTIRGEGYVFDTKVWLA